MSGQKVPMSRAIEAARRVAEGMGLSTGERDLAVLAGLLAHHAGIELTEEEKK